MYHRRRLRRSLAAALFGGLMVAAMFHAPAAGAAPGGEVAPLYSAAAGVIGGEYIVVYKSGVRLTADTSPATEMIATANGGHLRRRYTASIRGFFATLPAAALMAVRRDPHVAYVQANSRERAVAAVGSWGLDRVDQRHNRRDDSYSFDSTGRGVHVYVLDTGVRLTHTEFTGRIGTGTDTVEDDADPNDACGPGVRPELGEGHGTHVAGTIGGTTYGVAKKVTIHPVRVLDCMGFEKADSIVAGIDWVAANHVKPAVANMSLRKRFVVPAIDDAVRAAIATGVTFVLAAGNERTDACGQSPPRVSEGITVGASNSSDQQAEFSNVGTCLDLYAPGDDITSAWNRSDTATTIMRGTSMAAPHVAGVAAQYLQRHPRATPKQVRDAIVGNGTNGVLAGLGAGSPNVLLHAMVDTPSPARTSTATVVPTLR